MSRNLRDVEEGVTRDLRGRQTYAGYLDLDRLLARPAAASEPEHHDELLFIIQHQTSELWMKLIIHELDAALARLAADDLGPAQKILARVKQIQRQLFEQWGVLETLTPSEYLEFRDVLGPRPASSRCSTGPSSSCSATRTRRCSRSSATTPADAGAAASGLEAPSLYDEFLRHLARRGYPVPPDCSSATSRSRTAAARTCCRCSRRSTTSPKRDWEAYEMCEKLVDVEESFQLWRFRHMKTVQRIIGFKRGTGGSSGVGFLRGRSTSPSSRSCSTSAPRSAPDRPPAAGSDQS